MTGPHSYGVHVYESMEKLAMRRERAEVSTPGKAPKAILAVPDPLGPVGTKTDFRGL